ncbi:MAG TPA: type VII toxin-antitoxin system HepT family RNase toxin [Candidatus Brocadiia bacterium]|nr:nucleotidyltransferase domain-containing protein [Planctomycetota bacterium]MDO8093221.1 nucleotidyltransferase domain-containing protein [Candidatus Brocadiales bacterium]
MGQDRIKIKRLKGYSRNEESVLVAFLFGSKAKKRSSKISDWDIACYFKPISNTVEWECERDYPQESKVWGDLVEILETDNVDFIVLNRAPANIAASAIQGLPLVIKDRKLYLEFMLIVTREAEDYRQIVQEYAEIYWRSSSLSKEDREILNKRLVFLDLELQDSKEYSSLTKSEHETDRRKRREVERWIENLMNAAIDVSKTILASKKRAILSSYREVL